MDGRPTTAHFTFKDKLGRVYPPRAKRLAPDFFFQDQVYRPDGGHVLLPPGEFVMTYSRGPEYRQKTRPVTVPEKGEAEISIQLERWVNTQDYGFKGKGHGRSLANTFAIGWDPIRDVGTYANPGLLGNNATYKLCRTIEKKNIRQDASGKRILEVTTMGISRESRGQGFGRLLMQRAEAEARERGIEDIELSVAGNNRRARDLYRDLGYETVRRTMRKRLR